MKEFDFNIDSNLPPKKGHLLLSEPFLHEEYFTRSVILLCEHNENGSFGFVLNNYAEVDLSDIHKDLPAVMIRISFGGPVKKDNLYYLHTLGEAVNNSIPVANTLCMGGNFDDLVEVLKATPEYITQVRFFLGYSGWDEGQLENELKQKTWLVAACNSASELMSTESNTFWKDIMQQQSEKHAIVSKFPIDPNLN